jgi:hypothetical protein
MYVGWLHWAVANIKRLRYSSNKYNCGFAINKQNCVCWGVWQQV